MPLDPQLGAALDQAEARTQALTRRTAAAAVPPPKEPLDGAWLDIVRQAAERTLSDLTSGQMVPPMEPIPPGPVQQLPEGLAATLAALSSATQKLDALKPYSFSLPEVVTTNDGLRHLLTLLSSMGSDPKVLAALQREPPPST